MTDTTAGEGVVRPDYFDAGLLGDGGGGDVQWWQDYIRSLLEDAHEFYAALAENQALAAQPSAGAQDKPRGWERRWSRLGEQKTKDHTPKGWNLHEVTRHKLLPDDFPLYATPAQPDTGDVAALREVAYHAATVMRYLEEDGASIVAHLLDTDDNPGQRLRDALAALSKPNAPGAA